MPEHVNENREKPGANARLFSWLGAVAFVLTPVAVSAQSGFQPAAVESLGMRRCSELITAQTEDETLYAAFGVWIGGYLTAANAYEDDTFDLTPWQPVELATAQIAAACKQQGDATIAAATASYVKFLKDQRLTEKSELLRLRSGNQGMFNYESVLADIRTRLEAQGAKITDPEGQFGGSFGRALQSFQREHDLPETGLPDMRTLILLYR